MRSASVVKVNFTDAGLYGVFIGELIGQFSDGHWENSRIHKDDWELYRYETTFLADNVSEESSEELPTIRYNIEDFFAFVKKNDIKCIMQRTLMIYNHADLIKKVYSEEGKKQADKLIFLLSDADWISSSKAIENINQNREKELANGKTEESSNSTSIYNLNLIIKYFGEFENFLKEIPDVTDSKNIKKFRRIGTLLNRHFNHVKNYYELKSELVEF